MEPHTEAKKMKKPKRRYTHTGQIEVDINKARQKANDLLKSAESQEAYLWGLCVQGKLSTEEFAFEMAKVDKLRTRANNLMEKRIPYLIEKMAEFNTRLLPGILDDESVEA